MVYSYLFCLLTFHLIYLLEHLDMFFAVFNVIKHIFKLFFGNSDNPVVTATTAKIVSLLQGVGTSKKVAIKMPFLTKKGIILGPTFAKYVFVSRLTLYCTKIDLTGKKNPCIDCKYKTQNISISISSKFYKRF